MSIKQKSKIQVRSGLQQNLPRLSTGELGWAIDTQKLFIGNGTLAEGAPFLGVTEITRNSGGSSSIPQSGVPTGSRDGVNRTFILPGIPIAGTLIVWNNVPLIPSIGYSLSGNTIIYTVAPLLSDNLFFYGYF